MEQSTTSFRWFSRQRRNRHGTFQTAGFVLGSLATRTEDWTRSIRCPNINQVLPKMCNFGRVGKTCLAQRIYPSWNKKMCLRNRITKKLRTLFELTACPYSNASSCTLLSHGRSNSFVWNTYFTRPFSGSRTSLINVFLNINTSRNHIYWNKKTQSFLPNFHDFSFTFLDVWTCLNQNV